MDSRRFGDKVFFKVDKGEELVDSIIKICEEHKVELGSVFGIGATNKATIGLFDIDTKEYQSKEFIGNFEIAPAAGNVSTMKGETYLHLHINICDDKHNSYGGHLSSANISATFECVIDVIDGSVDRYKDKEIGLNLVKFD